MQHCDSYPRQCTSPSLSCGCHDDRIRAGYPGILQWHTARQAVPSGCAQASVRGCPRVYGGQSFGGAINIVTRHEQETTLEAGAQGGSFGTFDADARVGLMLGRTGHRVSGGGGRSDGAFKDPQGKIWELADPVVSPAFTSGLIGTPNELKLKYLADNDFKNLSGAALKDAISAAIKAKQGSLVGNMASQGTTPRQLTDLIGSLCDLTSGSGDKGTPVVLVQGYFDNFTD